MAKEIISVMKRYELKFHLDQWQVAYFKRAILEHMKIDRYGLTTIGSLYYDTPHFTLINRSIEKPFYKEKIRLRSYGLAKENSPVFLEIKRKNDKVVYKRRVVTDEKKAERFFQSKRQFEESQIARELEAFQSKYGFLEPKYLILYDRIAYFQEEGDLRVTLDQNPRYRTEDLNLHASLNGIPLLGEQEAILEVKVQHSIPLWLVGILSKGKIYQTSFSKVGAAHKKEMAFKREKQIVVCQYAGNPAIGGYQHEFAI
ncbi:MAG: polyphosphate polymerase domain-containing protein [Bacilli bacterium]|nr:polyphosphate polymerase domain-containing protein [Bacilli bacterium]